MHADQMHDPSEIGNPAKLIVVTPAGRERYLRLLAHYVLGEQVVHEWHLWDNCRNEDDRRYLHELAASDPRCKIKQLDGADGGFNVIGEFFRFCDDPEAFYLRLDDDVVYLEPGFLARFLQRALEQRGAALWFAPLVINNALCNTLIKHLSQVRVEGPVTAQAMCPSAWAHASFPAAMHPVLIEAAQSGRLAQFRVPDREVRLARLSINAIGFFGSEIVDLGDLFHAMGGEEEEWLSASLPTILDRPGRIFGDLIAADFSCYPQERDLLKTDILDRYYALAGLPAPRYEKPVDRVRLKDRLRPWRRKKKPELPHYSISLADGPGA